MIKSSDYCLLTALNWLRLDFLIFGLLGSLEIRVMEYLFEKVSMGKNYCIRTQQRRFYMHLTLNKLKVFFATDLKGL